MNITSCLCVICNELPTVVVESPCCHSIFCWGCVVELGSSSKKAEGGCMCPACQERVDIEGFRENFAIQKIIDNITVDCAYDGCLARFPASSRASHEAACVFAPVLCPHSELCGIMTRGALETHEETCTRRPVYCHFCATLVGGGELASHLANECADAWIECVNKCGTEGIKRASMDEHLTNACPFTIVHCPYEPYGCNEEFAREHTDVHLQSRAGVHLHMLSTNIEPFREYATALRVEVDGMRAEMAQLREEITALRVQPEQPPHIKTLLVSLFENIRPLFVNITFEKLLPVIALVIIVFLLLKALSPFKQVMLFGFIAWVVCRSINARNREQQQQQRQQQVNR